MWSEEGRVEERDACQVMGKGSSPSKTNDALVTQDFGAGAVIEATEARNAVVDARHCRVELL